MKNTALSHIHEALGAKMVPFAGYNMPVQYDGVNAEHLAVRNSIGVFDVSHMGEFHLKGKNALALIQKLTSNDASKLFDGKVQYSCLPNNEGGIVDDLLVYRIHEDEYMLVVNASNMEKDWNWITAHNDLGVTMTNQSDGMSLLAVQGPHAAKALQSLTDIDLNGMEYYSFKIGTFAGFDAIIVSATGYTGSGGFEIYMPNAVAEDIWNAVFKAGAAYDIKPAGLASRDTLRLEMGFCLYGNDIDDTTSPIEAGLGWITKFTKDFVNSEYIKSHKENGTKRKLVAFEMLERAIPRHEYPIVDATGNIIGVVTSGTMSPSLNMGIGMGYVPIEMSKLDTVIYIQIRNKNIPAKVVKLPFYKG
ncbi:MAG: glycine cleavage system aminomethyltransferase GcvT [Flavobacteriaceae bacterium]|nr:glycine cleavage system aminomethyltransferase GcvT [Flavobacteriaceae bacterium]